MENKIFQLCESCREEDLKNFDSNRFKANFKYDGERVMAVKKDDCITLFNRRGNLVYFSEIVDALKLLPFDFIIDGEVISMDNDFNKLQKRALTKDRMKIAQLEKLIPLKFMVFDILSFQKKQVSQEPLGIRLLSLYELFKENKSEHLQLCDYDDIFNMLTIAKEVNGEGIIIKDMNATYQGKRSNNWIKMKLFKETTITITGFTDNPKGIRATDDKNNVVQIAGFHADEVKQKLEADGYANINVQYLSISKDGKMRFPSYRGLA